MSQTTQLINTLKRALKAHGKTYADVANTLGLSEGSVKRLFSEKKFSLERFGQICQILDMEISDLVQLMHERSARIIKLTRQQEAEIAGDRKLLLVTVCVLNRWTFDDILQGYKIRKTDVIHYLATLDRVGLIELLPDNRIKLLVSANFHWISNGPIQNFFNDKVGQEIFNSRFDRQTEKLVVANAMLTRKSNAVLQKKIDRLLWEIEQINNDDARLPVSEKQGTTLVMALREWNFGVFSDLRR